MNGNIKSSEWNYINKIKGNKMKVLFNNENYGLHIFINFY